MDQIPATPAKVSFQGGLLTISSQNSTLGEILRDVRKLTGASIEIPPGSKGTSERVVAHLGPGTPRDVLVGLLNGCSFNYVMVGSNVDPAAVASVILTAKDGAGAPQSGSAPNPYQGGPVGMAANRYPAPHPFNPQAVQPGNGVAEPAEAEENKEQEEEPEAAEEPPDDQSQPVAPDPTTANAGDQPQADPNQPNAGPKTPEQILEMLRRPQPPGGIPSPAQQAPQPQPED